MNENIMYDNSTVPVFVEMNGEASEKFSQKYKTRLEVANSDKQS